MVVQPVAASGALRLLVVSSDTFPPTRVDVAVLFGAELAHRGHRIDWLLQSERSCSRTYTTPWGGGTAWVGSTDLGTSLFSRVRKHVRGILHDARLFSRLRCGDYDLIEVKDKFISGVFAVIAARLFRRRFIYWLSYPFPEHYLLEAADGTARYPFLSHVRGSVFKILLYRFLLPAADHVFVQSEQMRRDVAEQGVPLDRMTAVPMGVNLADFNPSSPSEPRRILPAGVPCVLYLGTLIKVRRMDFVIRVFERVLREMPNARLYMVGGSENPTDEKLLVDEARRLGILTSVTFTGQLPRQEALCYVQEADVCVSPFFPTPILNSTSPTKLVEYMAMAKPVVANDHPEQRLVIEESGAGYCVPYEEAAFAAAVLKLMAAPEIAREMGQRGRRYVAEHRTYPKIADDVERELRNVVGRA